MTVDTSVIGRVSGRRVVVVERGPVAAFAAAVKNRSRIYRDRDAAVEAGFTDVPVPPTFPFAMGYWGTFRELQANVEPVSDNPMFKVMGSLGPGLILHGEQEFEYHRAIVVGDVLNGVDTLADVYVRESETHVMTFVVTETCWTEAETADPVLTARFNLIHRARKDAR